MAQAVLLLTLALLGAQISAASAEAITAMDLTTIREVEGLSVSPDTSLAVFQMRQADPVENSYNLTWVIYSLSEREVIASFDGGEPILASVNGRFTGYIDVERPIWSSNNDFVVFIKQTQGRQELWRAFVSGRAEFIATFNARVHQLTLSPSGESIFVELEPDEEAWTRAREHERRRGFLYDDRFFPSYSSHPIRTSLPLRGDRSPSGTLPDRQLMVVSMATIEVSAASEAELGLYRELRVSESPTGLSRVVVRAIDSGANAGLPVRTVGMLSVGAEAPIVCGAAECSSQIIEGAWKVENTITFARREGPAYRLTALYSWDIESGAVRHLFSTPDLIFFSECAHTGSDLICLRERSLRPRHLISIDLLTGEVTDLFDPNENLQSLENFYTLQTMELQLDAGAETFGYVVRPRGREFELLPLVIVTYRCRGFLSGGTGNEYPIMPLASEGYVVLCLEFPLEDYGRLMTEGWEDFQRWSRGPGDPMKRRIQLAIDLVVSELHEDGLIDRHRVALTGLSYGAEAVSYALFNMSGLTAAIASGTEIGPASPFLYGPRGQRGLEQWGLGAVDSKRWNALSVTRNTESVSAPLLLHVSDHELLGRLEMYTALREARRPVEMFVFEDEYHVKWQPSHRLAIYERNIDWLNFWLQGIADPGPERREQFERWRAMREEMATSKLESDRDARLSAHPSVR